MSASSKPATDSIFIVDSLKVCFLVVNGATGPFTYGAFHPNDVDSRIPTIVDSPSGGGTESVATPFLYV